VQRVLHHQEAGQDGCKQPKDGTQDEAKVVEVVTIPYRLFDDW
jgi:hypothetical protein